MPNDSSTATVSIKILDKILNIVPHGAAIYNQNGHCVIENKLFAVLGSLRPKFDFNSSDNTTYLPVAFDNSSKTPGWATMQRLDENLSLVTINSSEKVFSTDVKAFRLMLEAHSNGYNLYQAAALAIGLSTGWRWVGISRLINFNHSVEVLGFWDSNKLTDIFSYELAKTPCEKVFDDNNIIEFSQVCDLFPEDTMLIEMGAFSFAGKVYKNGDKKFGHIFMMSDKPKIVTSEIETILSSFAEYIGSRLEIFHHIQKNVEFSELVNTDKLTGLGNRLALENTVQQCQNAHSEGKIDDVLIVFIDLDGMKDINDTYGHEQGDRMLQTFSSFLLNHCRNNDDIAFRLGGDEFIWLLKNPTHSAAFQAKERIHSVIATLQQSGFPNIGASMGIAHFADNNWDFKATLHEADINMYADKRARKLKLINEALPPREHVSLHNTDEVNQQTIG